MFKKLMLVSCLILSISAQGTNMTKEVQQVSGEFDVNLTPVQDDEIVAGRLIIHKKYNGALQGVGSGQMLSKRIPEGHAAYVAIEEFTGELDGKKGGFTLVHNGSMSASHQTLSIDILPSSGTHDLAGITGKMTIEQQNGKHLYTLTYQLNTQ